MTTVVSSVRSESKCCSVVVRGGDDETRLGRGLSATATFNAATATNPATLLPQQRQLRRHSPLGPCLLTDSCLSGIHFAPYTCCCLARSPFQQSCHRSERWTNTTQLQFKSHCHHKNDCVLPVLHFVVASHTCAIHSLKKGIPRCNPGDRLVRMLNIRLLVDPDSEEG